MTPEEQIRYRLQGIANRIDRALEPIERRLRMTRPETDEERWRRMRDESNRRGPRKQ